MSVFLIFFLYALYFVRTSSALPGKIFSFFSLIQKSWAELYPMNQPWSLWTRQLDIYASRCMRWKAPFTREAEYGDPCSAYLFVKLEVCVKVSSLYFCIYIHMWQVCICCFFNCLFVNLCILSSLSLLYTSPVQLGEEILLRVGLNTPFHFVLESMQIFKK